MNSSDNRTQEKTNRPIDRRVRWSREYQSPLGVLFRKDVARMCHRVGAYGRTVGLQESPCTITDSGHILGRRGEGAWAWVGAKNDRGLLQGSVSLVQLMPEGLSSFAGGV